MSLLSHCDAYARRFVWLSLVAGLLAAGCAKGKAEPVGASTSPRETSQGSIWHETLETAYEESRRLDRPILLDFSGVEWCEPCQQLRKNVFESDEFAKWAEDKVVLVELVVPQQGKPRSAELSELIERYDVRSFPTVCFIDSQGEAIGSIPGSSDDPYAWIKLADTLLHRRESN